MGFRNEYSSFQRNAFSSAHSPRTPPYTCREDFWASSFQTPRGTDGPGFSRSALVGGRGLVRLLTVPHPTGERAITNPNATDRYLMPLPVVRYWEATEYQRMSK